MDVEGIGDLPCVIQGEFYLLKEVQHMPNNSECSLGLTALKTWDDFVEASHDVGTSLILCTPSDSFKFLSKKDMRYKNLMDYLPIQLNVFPQNTKWSRPSQYQANAVTTRSRNKIPVKPSLNIQENLLQVVEKDTVVPPQEVQSS